MAEPMIRGRLITARRHVRAIAASMVGLVLSYGLGLNAYPNWSWLHRDEWLLDPAGDWEHAYALAHGFKLATIVALLLTAAIPLFLLLRRDRARPVRFEEEATGFSVAADGPGFSVAVGRGDTTQFVEVDSLDDARHIAAEVKARFPAQGELALTLPRQSPLMAVGILSLVALAYAAFVPLFASLWGGLALLGVTAPLVFMMLATLVILRSRQPMKLRWGTSGESRAPRKLDLSPLERHVRRHLEARLMTDPAPPRVRVDLFARGSDSVTTWLARIDAMPRGASYRDEAAPRELLFETLADANAAIDVRLAAARILRLRDGEERERIREAVTDEEIRVRVDAVTLDEPEEAEAALDAVGPMFRTRS